MGGWAFHSDLMKVTRLEEQTATFKSALSDLGKYQVFLQRQIFVWLLHQTQTGGMNFNLL